MNSPLGCVINGKLVADDRLSDLPTSRLLSAGHVFPKAHLSGDFKLPCHLLKVFDNPRNSDEKIFFQENLSGDCKVP